MFGVEIRKIFVAGAGLMGGGIAQVCAQAGYGVVMRDLSTGIVEESLENIRWSTRKLVLCHSDNRDGRGDSESSQCRGNALLQPGSSHERRGDRGRTADLG